jgi:hypothetical protein
MSLQAEAVFDFVLQTHLQSVFLELILLAIEVDRLIVLGDDFEEGRHVVVFSVLDFVFV